MLVTSFPVNPAMPHLMPFRHLDGRPGQMVLCLQLFRVQAPVLILLLQQLLPPALSLEVNRQLLHSPLLSSLSAVRTITKTLSCC